ncbi:MULTISPECIES: hypothetical protein [Brevibacterium]|uniref:Uncharacterized protein n=2 Tax=Brevibacterium TaxID=1696 RepID=A0A2A3Z3D3_BREAU|nr:MULTISPECIES: hypothetical protein [Brevibacterium]MDN5773755.1 hypothetical protein [Brevibacterium aurantiacum]MDN5794041.1 hypothetical protein [Brevibacterium aurantiacum]PCC46037.1 hypothetical protein CIK64_13510 [Brevibacterium aurantiacum]WCE40468.1 hypothetical protein PGC08_01840 [Brevibacterium sp. BDJS002]
MCRAVTCTTCGKTTWDGCGLHIDSVKREVPAQQWCGGHDPEPEQKGNLVQRLFGLGN